MSPNDIALDKGITKAQRKDCREARSMVRVLVIGSAYSGKTTLIKGFAQYLQPDATTTPTRAALYAHLRETLQTASTPAFFGPGFESDLSPGSNPELMVRLLARDDIQSALVELPPDKASKLENAEFWLAKQVHSRLDYHPDFEDALRMRSRESRSSTAEETHVCIDGVNFVFINLHESLMARDKILRFFQGFVTSVMFVVDVSTYNLTNAEGLNVLETEMERFEQFCTIPSLTKLPIILCLNKADVLAKKLARGVRFTTPVGSRFADFVCEEDDDNSNALDLSKVKDYISQAFTSRHARAKREDGLYVHFTTSVSGSMHFVFNACKDVVLKECLRASGFMD